MATIAVRVGREVKEISGLTNRTTCWDVVLALLKEKQLTQGIDSANGGAERTSTGGQCTEESASNSSMSKSMKELAQSYVVVENWRGCEKPIPPRTRILNVWQAWGKEQRHVELSLKKSKHIRYREGSQANGRISSPSRDQNGLDEDGNTNHYSLHRLSQNQKRRIRRNLMQYQRAVMMQQDDVDESDDLRCNNENIQPPNEAVDNRRILFNDAQRNSDVKGKSVKSEAKSSDKRNGLILSEEKFVDGVLTGPDCLIKRADRAQLISQGNFNREYCKYRRRNHRRKSSEDGAIDSRHHRRRNVSHYPYSSHHYRRRSSRHRGSRSKNHKSSAYRYSTDDTTSTTTTTTTNTSEDENAEDADDEKSVLIEFACPVPRRTHPYSVGLGGCSYSSSCTTTTATDSSTTTSGDSMTSSIGCSTSSETSSGGDYFSHDAISFPPKRIAPPLPLENMQILKTTNNSSTTNKPKKTKSILGGLPKPALNLIESFRKTNLKRKSTKKACNQATSKSDSAAQNINNGNKESSNKTQTPDVTSTKSTTESIDGKDKANVVPTVDNTQIQVDNKITDNTKENNNKVGEEEESKKEHKETAEDETEQDVLEQLAQMVVSQDIVLKNQQRRLTETDLHIEQIENDIHKLRTRALGKNYVQDTYLSGLMDTESNSVTALNTILSSPTSPPVTTPWILECDNVEQLEQYIKDCEKIVEMQLKIEQYQRNSEIILQEMQEEVWRVSTDASDHNGQNLSPVSKAAALMLGLNDDEEMSEDESRHEVLSVTNCMPGSNKKSTETIKKSSGSNIKTETSNCDMKQGPAPLELEISRTELETSLYLSLRLAAEIEEVDQRLGTSENLIQKKGENLIKCVRDMAISEEGINPDIWEEYGELLTAYDIEVQERNYLDILEASHLAVLEAEGTCTWDDTEDAHYIDATSPNPTSHCISDDKQRCSVERKENAPSAPHSGINQMDSRRSAAPSSSIHHALSPWMWCEHCKMEENIIRSKHPQADTHHLHHQAHSQHQVEQHHPQPPKSFSDLPLPRPLDTKSVPPNSIPSRKPGIQHTPPVMTPGLLPMLPLPDGLMSSPRYNDSDYEDLPDTPLDKRQEINKDGLENHLTKEHQTSHTHGHLSSSLSSTAADSSSNNADDSGNASAGSTTSFASSDGSRNSSCDGGSPRPLPSTLDNNQGSNSIFGRNGVLRGSWKGHFVFPPHSKSSNSQQVPSTSQGKSVPSSKKAIPPPPPPAHTKPNLKRPELPPKPSQCHSLGTKQLHEQELLMQQQKLIRRNSAGRRKNLGVNQTPNAYAKGDAFGRNPTTAQKVTTDRNQCGLVNQNFAPRGSSFKNTIVKGINGISSNISRNFSQSRNAPQTITTTHSSVPTKQNLIENQRVNSNYDNDSDTGRSSLHSADSDPLMCSETLV